MCCFTVCFCKIYCMNTLDWNWLFKVSLMSAVIIKIRDSPFFLAWAMTSAALLLITLVTYRGQLVWLATVTARFTASASTWRSDKWRKNSRLSPFLHPYLLRSRIPNSLMTTTRPRSSYKNHLDSSCHSPILKMASSSFNVIIRRANFGWWFVFVATTTKEFKLS